MVKGSRTNQRLPLSSWKKNLTQDVVVSSMDHHLVLILVEMLDHVALTEVAIKG